MIEMISDFKKDIKKLESIVNKLLVSDARKDFSNFVKTLGKLTDKENTKMIKELTVELRRLNDTTDELKSLRNEVKKTIKPEDIKDLIDGLKSVKDVLGELK
jgi:seryl-tRNA synthetase